MRGRGRALPDARELSHDVGGARATQKVGTVTLNVKKAGQGGYTLRTKIGKRTLLKGRYTLTLQLTAGTQHSKTSPRS